MLSGDPSAYWLRFDGESVRARTFFQALLGAAPLAQIRADKGHSLPAPLPDWLLLWGPGHPTRIEPMRLHLESRPASGRDPHVIAADLSYWDRDQRVRLSIDDAHPTTWVMKRDWPASRFLRNQPFLSTTCWKADGPILIAGVGRKAQVQYGPGVQVWEAHTVRHCLERWPGRKVYYRPKRPNESPTPPGAVLCPGGSIDQVLKGCSLVCTWHSNVAVDAIRLGIPVCCCGGAAAAVCPSVLPEQPTPLDPDLRMRFLQNLAWFQWGQTEKEARGCWEWLIELLS